MVRAEHNTPASFLRRVAATLMCLSGIGQVASLWLRQLTGMAMLDAMTGFLYILIGIGLFGRSRLSLSLAIAIPSAAIVLIMYGDPQPAQAYRLHCAIDAMVLLLCTIELWRVRHNSSV
ncbi:MAG: hypothetical protein HRT77_07800 [Halioglobus sp.]|nr:hypothetical protein [Halioglobus sp.]